MHIEQNSAVRAPAVSIITPFYNRAPYYLHVVNTLSRQTFTDFELIVVDDGSTDDLRATIETVETTFPVLIIQQERNVGAATARNCGIDAARGRYVAFLDSDDGWMPDKLLLQFQQAENSRNPDHLVSLTRQTVLSDRTYVVPRRLPSPKQSVGEYLFRGGGIIQSSMMFMRADLAKSVRFVDGGRGHDDWSFALRLEKAGGRFEMLPEPLTIYNDEPGRERRSPSYSQGRFDWLDQWRELLGERPYLAARAAVASQMGRSLSTSDVIWAAFMQGAIPTWRSAYYGAAWAFPAIRDFAVFAKQVWLGGSLGWPRRSSGIKSSHSVHPS